MSSCLTCAASAGDTPSTWIVSTANSPLSRAIAYRPRATRTSASPIARDRPDGTKRNRSSFCLRGSARTFSPTGVTSPRGRRVLLLERRQLDVAEEDDLVLELDAVLLPGPAPRFCHQRERIVRPCAVGVLDEVRVTRGDLRAADPMALQAAGLEHASGRELVVRILEDAAERALVRRLRRLALPLQVGDDRLDLVGRARHQPEFGRGDYLPRLKSGSSVGEPELSRRPPAGSVGAHDEGALEDRRPVAAVRARVHPHAATGRAGNGTGELEPAQARGSSAMQGDGIRRTAPGDEQLSPHLSAYERARELEREPPEAGVGDEEIRTEPDRRDCQLLLACEA